MREGHLIEAGNQGFARRATTLLTLGVALVALAGLQACTESAEVAFDFTSQGHPTRSVSIDNFEGSVNLKKGPAGSAVSGRVRVIASGFDKKADAHDAAADVELTESGSELDMNLVVVVPNVRGGKQLDVDMDLFVPDGVAVSVTTDNGRIVVDSLPIIVLDTTNGPVTTRFTSGPATIRTNDFPITMESHQGDIDVRTSNASMELIAIAGNVRATSTNGAVTVRVSPPSAGEIFIATTFGGVDLTIASDFGARLLAVTSGQGLVFVEGLRFTPRATPPGQAEGTIGNGSGLIDVRTSDADIVIRGR